jgi:hypothetical protein
MPSLVILPFIQCHHTRGIAALAGVTNPTYTASFEDVFFVCEKAANEHNIAVTNGIIFFMKWQFLKAAI